MGGRSRRCLRGRRERENERPGRMRPGLRVLSSGPLAGPARPGICVATPRAAMAKRDFLPSVVGYWPDTHVPASGRPTSDTPGGGGLSALSGLSFSGASRAYSSHEPTVLKTAGRSHRVPASVSRSLGVRPAVRDFPPSVVVYRPDPQDPRHLCHDPTSDTPGGVLSALSGLSFSAALRTYWPSTSTATWNL